MSYMIFKNRVDAGKLLANKLVHFKNQPGLLVLGLPRGGVPVASEIARELQAQLDVLIVRKLGHPQWPELAIGAIATGDICIFNHYTLQSAALNDAQLNAIIDREKNELNRREKLYRGNKPPLAIEGNTIILVDDGLATGATMAAAIKALRQKKPKQIIAAIPVSSVDALRRIQELADEVICLQVPAEFSAVGCWYHEFTQTTDDEVRALLG